jgi:hypothetical protein
MAGQRRAGTLHYAIHYMDLGTRESSLLFESEAPGNARGVAVSPDESWILYAEHPRATAELMLVENFR